MADAYDIELGHLLREHREQALGTMAAFCHYWRLTPAEYKVLRYDEIYAMFEFMRKRLQAQQRENRRR